MTQRELARRAGRPQSSIARWESGKVRPSLETLRELIHACGLELTYGLANYDDSYVAHIEQNLRLTPRQRVDRALANEHMYERIRSAARA